MNSPATIFLMPAAFLAVLGWFRVQADDAWLPVQRWFRVQADDAWLSVQRLGWPGCQEFGHADDLRGGGWPWASGPPPDLFCLTAARGRLCA
jgi:hypothetical protein